LALHNGFEAAPKVRKNRFKGSATVGSLFHCCPDPKDASRACQWRTVMKMDVAEGISRSISLLS
jgi:hypothetical protein